MDREVSFRARPPTIVNWTKSENLVTECLNVFFFCEVARGKVLNLSHSSAFPLCCKALVLFKLSHAVICLA